MDERSSWTDYVAQHFGWEVDAGVAVITLNRPERKNPLTFQSYAELRDVFTGLCNAKDIHAVVIHGAGGNFCSGGDVHEIIGPLTKNADGRVVEIYPYDRRLGQSDARLPAGDYRRGGWCLCWRWRHHRHGI